MITKLINFTQSAVKEKKKAATKCFTKPNKKHQATWESRARGNKADKITKRQFFLNKWVYKSDLKDDTEFDRPHFRQRSFWMSWRRERELPQSNRLVMNATVSGCLLGSNALILAVFLNYWICTIVKVRDYFKMTQGFLQCGLTGTHSPF